MSEETRMTEELEIRTVQVMRPDTGELFDLEKPDEAARAFFELRALEERLAEMRRAAGDALVEEAQRLGRKTLRLGEHTVEITGGPGATGIDCEILRKELTKAGCPEERINEAIKETVEYKADRSVCRQLAGANPAYKKAVDKATYTFEKRYGVRVG